MSFFARGAILLSVFAFLVGAGLGPAFGQTLFFDDFEDRVQDQPLIGNNWTWYDMTFAGDTCEGETVAEFGPFSDGDGSDYGAENRNYYTASEDVGQIPEQPGTPEAATTDDHAVAAGLAHHPQRVPRLPDVPVSEYGNAAHLRLQPRDRAPVGHAVVELRRGTRVERDRRASLSLTDPTGVEKRREVVIDSHTELHGYRNAPGASHGRALVAVGRSGVRDRRAAEFGPRAALARSSPQPAALRRRVLARARRAGAHRPADAARVANAAGALPGVRVSAGRVVPLLGVRGSVAGGRRGGGRGGPGRVRSRGPLRRGA